MSHVKDVDKVHQKKFRFAIDRGGTFTDIYAECPSGKKIVTKLLSVDAHYADAPTEGIRRILEQELQVKLTPGQPIDPELIECIRMGTTVATNALLERKGERMVLAITEGFRDLLHIGNQSRPNIFDLAIRIPDVLYEEVLEVKERVVLKRDDCNLGGNHPVKDGATSEQVEVWKEVDEEDIRNKLKAILQRGIRCLAVVLMNSYTYGHHEQIIKKLATELGFEHVSLSSEVMPMVKIVPRGFTACVDAYLTPIIHKYVEKFSLGFKGGLDNVRTLFMQSDGGLTLVEKFCGSRAILSGPAGGVVGFASVTQRALGQVSVIGFDMGGTSTDVARYALEYEHTFESTTAGITIQTPQLDINTVAAGGGSRLFFRNGIFVVGPESAGADPGPASYRKGGPLTITDANLVLGRLRPEYFPKIFGQSKDRMLDEETPMLLFSQLTQEINAYLRGKHKSPVDCHKELSVHEVAAGFIRVANECMARPIRALTQARGYDTSKHVLCSFGGAGGQHACAIGELLGMTKVFIHKYSGALSAYGMALADIVHEVQEPCSKIYTPCNYGYLAIRIQTLMNQCRTELMGTSGLSGAIKMEIYLGLRYKGTDCALMCRPAAGATEQAGFVFGDFLTSFLERYKTEFGFSIPGRDIIVDDIRVRGVFKSAVENGTDNGPLASSPPVPEKRVLLYVGDTMREVDLYLYNDLLPGHRLLGPALIVDTNSTVFVEPHWQAEITLDHDLLLEKVTLASKSISNLHLDTIQLSIFSHRFMSIAEQMGRVLQRTAISTNIKERLDFSCAMFGPDGGLVANAPHIPVHLGAMQETVKYQIEALGTSIHSGDVILSNHPVSGGSHLPDLTVITPVFWPGQERPVFFVACRGHHADIGGITPGSMPPHSKSIFEEGAVFTSFKVVDQGVFQEECLIGELMKPGQFPGSSGTRCLQDNLSDLKAQIAANQKGISLISDLIEEYSLEVVQVYMQYIQENAEMAVQEMLKTIASTGKGENGHSVLFAEDFMDDGSPIRLKVDINSQTGTALFDFSGTGPEVYGNCNAPRAVTLSALIYCLRCLVKQDIPLNQGCLKPITVIIPKGSLIDPSPYAAVVGGNVLTSQRIVDVIFKAFEACAASQGCMNNITFGDSAFGYYETVSGGAGAGPGWDGRSGVHTHMTNTRITDPEILERRYPVILQSYHLNPGTGGRGLYKGGNGVVRELLFRKNLTLSVMTERRTLRPYGLKGGSPGQSGKNLLFTQGRVINLQAKTCVDVKAGDVFHLETPGGGGFGDERERPEGEMARFTPLEESSLLLRGSVQDYRNLQESA